MIISDQRGTSASAEEKKRRSDLRMRIADLSMKFMLTDDDLDAIQAFQEEYYALLTLAESDCAALTATEKKHLRIFKKNFGRADAY